MGLQLQKVKFKFLVIISLSLLLIGLRAEAINKKRFKVIADNSPSLAKAKLKKVFDTKLNRERYFKNKLLVKFKAGTSQEAIQEYMAINNLVIIKKLSKRIYSCKLNRENIQEEEVLDLVDKEIQTAEIEDLDLDEYKQITTDAVKNRYVKNYSKSYSKKLLVELQWYLGSGVNQAASSPVDINVEGAWQVTKGQGIKVAVIDTGFDLTHPDINFAHDSYDVIGQKDNAQAPDYSKENHGTAVAGIIAARENPYGVVGVAPEAEIIPIRLITEDGFVSVSDIVEAHQKALELGATIINNSWGSYDPSVPDGESINLTRAEEDLYRELAEEANNGKGVVVVFASGNSGEANFNRVPEARNPYNFAVGAVDSSGKKASYSIYGNELDLVAPGGDSSRGIVTTDRRDVKVKDLRKKKAKIYILGYERGDYVSNFKGTSASAPIVSGVAALVWAANPNLTAAQVKAILQNSATRNISGYNFNNGICVELGAGIVNASAAVEQALAY